MLAYTEVRSQAQLQLQTHPAIKSVFSSYGATNLHTLFDWKHTLFQYYVIGWWANDWDCEDTGDATGGGLLHTLAGGCGEQEIDAISPVKLVTAESPPTVMYHGTMDSLVAFSQARELEATLNKFGRPNYLLKLNSFDHIPEWGYYGAAAQMQRYAFERLVVM
jgi:hypothetical protein